MKTKAPSIRDVAAAAGVSTATVSRALSSPDKVSAPTRDAVFRAIEQTGYRLNIAARNLRKRETGAVAVLVPNLANPFFSAILSGIAAVMSEAGYNVLVTDTTPFGRGDGVTGHQFPAFANARHVDGLIVLDGLLPAEALDSLGPPQIRPPTVYACEWSELVDRPRVTIDNVAAGQGAVEHLVALGHSKIGHLCGPPENVLTRERLKGAQAALAAAGLAMAPGWVYPGDFSLESGARAADAWCAAPDRPTAVFCASDVMAIGFIGALMRRGVKVPAEVSVIGFDDLDMASHFVPALTTVRQPRPEIGQSAARLLLERMDLSPATRAASPGPRLVLPTELVVRETTAPPPVG
ncbi:MAG TPA: LacI family transcriptional regulator [Rhodobacteraceae bacterium]|nr:LacI family transcriptional regulator [Paracoccaceae bacterium]